MPHRLPLFALLVILVVALAACGAAPAATAPTAASAQANAPATTAASAPTALPTTAAAPTAAPAPTAAATPAPASTSAPLADTNPEKPNDTTQGRLRITNCILGGPGVDMLINGKLTVNGGVTQANVGERQTGGYQYLAPGTYSTAIVPTGQGIDKALLGPLDVTIAAGHRYTLALLGQRDDAKGTPLLIDETAAYQEIGADPRGVAHITINNVKGAPGLDQLQDDIVRDKNAPYGGFAAGIWPVGPIKGFALTISGARDKVLVNVPAPGFNTPGVDYLDCIAGRYPGTFEQDYNGDSSASTSQLSLLAFLQLQNEVGAKYPGKASTFNTFLSALKTTGMEDELAKGGPYLILPPTDTAFAALPKDKFDALMADPKALADLLRAHIVETYAPTGSLGRTFTTMHGEQIKVGFNDYKLVVNDELIGPTLSAFVANGTRVVSAEKLLLDVK